jgi:hypothetical protein
VTATLALGALFGLLCAMQLTGRPPAEDTFAPRNSIRFECGGSHANLSIVDSGADDTGLRRIAFVQERSVGVVPPMIPEFDPGTGRVSFTVSTPSGTASGRAVIIAEDLAGNADTIQINFLVNVPEVSVDSILMDGVKRTELRERPVTVRNVSPLDRMVIDSLFLRSGQRFRLKNLGSGAVLGRNLLPGELFQTTVTFQSGLRGDFSDTLVCYVDCDSIVIPLRCVMARPIIELDYVDFWQVLVGGQKCLDMGLRNIGNDTLIVSAIEVGGDYQFDTTALPDVPVRLIPSQAISVPVCFIPRQLGVQVGTVTVESNATNDGTAGTQLVGIGVNSVAAVGYDGNGDEVQLTVVSQGPFLTVVSADRSRDLTDFAIFNVRGEEIPYESVEKVGEGWWQVNLSGRLLNGLYYMFALSPNHPHVTVKFVVLE